MSLFTAIDLFSGCGGSSLGFNKAGFDIRSAVEIDSCSNQTYSKNHPETKLLETDIRYVSGNDLLSLAGLKRGECAVLLACPPCQGFSSARRKNQRNDPRNTLIFEFVRLADEIKPKIVVMENVPGLSRGEGKRIFLDAVRRLKRLGYGIEYDKLDSEHYGIPQKRKRIILLGSRLNHIRLAFPSITHGVEGSLSPLKTVKDEIKNLPKIRAGESHTEDPMHASAHLSELNLERMKATPADGGSRKDWPAELVLECHKRDNSGHTDVYGRMRWDFPSPTLTAGCISLSKGRFGHPEQNRAISLREAARLQSFPDDYAFEGPFQRISEQIGNAVPPLLAQRIAESLLLSLRETAISDSLYSEIAASRDINPIL